MKGRVWKQRGTDSRKTGVEADSTNWRGPVPAATGETERVETTFMRSLSVFADCRMYSENKVGVETRAGTKA